MTETTSALPARRNPVVREENGSVFANSRDVATFFEKQHRHVLEAVDNLIKSEASCLPFFRQGVYSLAETGKQEHRCFDMSRDGFMLLGMGFTGAKALKWKMDYIAAFNAMEAELTKLKPVANQFDVMRAVIDNLENNNQRLFSVEKAVENLGAHEDFKSIKAYAALTGRKISTKESGELGRAATAVSKQDGYKIGKQPDETYGFVNTYHRDVLARVFAIDT